MNTSKSRALAIVAVPILRVSARVVLEKGRGWSAIDELVLWALSIKARSATQLAKEIDLPRRVVLEIIYRMMRFRLIEAVLIDGTPCFRVTDYGSNIVRNGEEIPTLQRKMSRKVAFVVDKITGTVFPKREVRVENATTLNVFRESGADVHEIQVRGRQLQTSPAQNVARFQEILNPDETLVFFDGDTLIERDDEYLIVTADGGDFRGLPQKAPMSLATQIKKALSARPSTRPVTVESLITVDDEPTLPAMVRSDFDPGSDLIVGGPQHETTLRAILGNANRRVLIHSSFVKKDSFDNVADLFRGAVRRGARVDIFWGAGSPSEPKEATLSEATAIAKAVAADETLRGNITVHLRSTGSHAKLIIADDGNGNWTATVGSCNWLFSRFDRLEVSTMLRGNAAVAEVANMFCKMIAQPGFRPEVGSELYILAKTLRNAPPLGKYMIGLASGQMHEALLRQASGTAERRFIIASDRLGNAVFANAIVPAEVFQKRTGITPLVVYGQNVGAVTGPTAAAGVAEEAKGRGVHIICPPQGFHAKFLLWGDTDIVITSLNWGSATVSPNTPYAEVGIHLQGPGLVEHFLMRLKPAWTFLDQG